MPLVTKDWKSSLTRTALGWEATETYKVSDVSGEVEAQLSSGVPQPGNSHVSNASLRVISVTATGGPVVYVVTALYSTLFNNVSSESESDPLRQKPNIVYRQSVEYIESDRDINYNPIINTAGDPISPGGQYPIIVERLSIAQNEPFFDRTKAFEFINAVNDDAVTFLGATFGVGQVKCIGIAPSVPFDTDSRYLTIVYDFEIRNNPETNPHQLWLRMAGLAGWYDDSGVVKRGQFVYQDGSPVAADVLLRRDGTPFDLTIGVLASDGETVAMAVAPPSSALGGVSPLEVREGAGQTLVCFEIRPRKSFQGLI